MLGRIQEETDEMFVIGALNSVSEKLIRRHPHIFSSASADSPGDVLELWNRMKAKEGKMPKEDDFFSRIPPALPIFEKAAEIQQKMRKVGFDWPNSDGVFEKVQEEIREVRESLEGGGDTEEELGDLLFSVINLTRFLGYNPSYALRRANEKVQARFNGWSCRHEKRVWNSKRRISIRWKRYGNELRTKHELAVGSPDLPGIEIRPGYLVF